jgi:hypothetical protein
MMTSELQSFEDTDQHRPRQLHYLNFGERRDSKAIFATAADRNNYLIAVSCYRWIDYLLIAQRELFLALRSFGMYPPGKGI